MARSTAIHSFGWFHFVSLFPPHPFTSLYDTVLSIFESESILIPFFFLDPPYGCQLSHHGEYIDCIFEKRAFKWAGLTRAMLYHTMNATREKEIIKKRVSEKENTTKIKIKGEKGTKRKVKTGRESKK